MKTERTFSICVEVWSTFFKECWKNTVVQRINHISATLATKEGIKTTITMNNNGRSSANCWKIFQLCGWYRCGTNLMEFQNFYTTLCKRINFYQILYWWNVSCFYPFMGIFSITWCGECVQSFHKSNYIELELKWPLNELVFVISTRSENSLVHKRF